MRRSISCSGWLRKGRKLTASLGLAAVAVMALSGTALGTQVNGPTPIGASGLTAGHSYTYTFDPSFNGTDTTKTALRNAITQEIATLALSNAGRPDWIGANLPRFTYTTATSATLKLGYSHAQAVACNIKDPKSASTIACTTAGAIWFSEQGTPTWMKYCEVAAVSGCYTAKTILLHEMGHFLGLGHYPWTTDVGPGATYTVMQPQAKTLGTAGYNQTYYGTCDVAAFQEKYGVLSTASTYSPCLPSVKVSLTLAPASTTVSWDSSVTFTATLKVATGQAVAVNLIANRRVYLITSTDGGTTWTKPGIVLTQNSPGVYSAIASGLITTSLWRAVYDDPGAGEALLGATSASSTVTVKPLF